MRAIQGIHRVRVRKARSNASTQVQWYNEVVQSAFRLRYPPDTLAVSIISTPSMFEKTFKPFVASTDWTNRSESPSDPLDRCIHEQLEEASRRLADRGFNVDIIHDYDLDFTRKPRILVQTAGHVSGQAYYYQRSHVTASAPWPTNKPIYGVSIHPKYGGWFAFRGVLIFRDVAVELKRREPEDVVSTNEKRIELLEKFNSSWEDFQYRDVVPVEERYSDEQKAYFAATPGAARRKLLGLPSLNDVN